MNRPSPDSLYKLRNNDNDEEMAVMVLRVVGDGKLECQSETEAGGGGVPCEDYLP